MPNSLSQGTMMTHLMISYVPHYFTCQPAPRSTLPPDFQLSLVSQKHSKEIRGWVECGVSIFIPMAPLVGSLLVDSILQLSGDPLHTALCLRSW